MLSKSWESYARVYFFIAAQIAHIAWFVWIVLAGQFGQSG